MKMKNFWLKYRSYLTLFVALLCYLLVMRLLGITCIIKHITGISCPGCGMTRAFMSALRLDWRAAFYYHPLWILLPPFAVGLLWSKIQNRRRVFSVLGISLLLLLFVVYLIRMFLPNGGIVVFEPQNSAIAQFYRAILSV